jgi:hypothetical protein
MIRFLEFVYSQCKFKVFIILFYVLPRQSASRLAFPPRSLPSALFLKMQDKKLFIIRIRYTTLTTQTQTFKNKTSSHFDNRYALTIHLCTACIFSLCLSFLGRGLR